MGSGDSAEAMDREPTRLEREPIRLEEERARVLVERMTELAQSARTFGSAVCGLDMHVSWALSSEGRTLFWSEGEHGLRSVSVRLDLNRAIKLIETTRVNREGPHVDAFLAGFLHELGHVLYGGPPEEEAAADRVAAEQAGGESKGAEEAGAEVRARPDFDELLDTIRETLEDARVERLLLREFRGARRQLEGHARRVAAVARAQGSNRLNRLVAMLFLQLWGLGEQVPEQRLPADILETSRELRGSLLQAAGSAKELEDWIDRWLVPRLAPFLSPYLEDDARSIPQRHRKSVEGGQEDEGADEQKDEQRRPAVEMKRSLQMPELISDRRHLRTKGVVSQADEDLAERELISYPHRDGGVVVLDEIAVARAQDLTPDERASQVWQDVAQRYGPMAVEGFAVQAAALRRAFQVNFERRFGGRYRAGRRVGVANARRFVVRQDLRLFQRMDVPNRLSYYFHLLIDVSPSMLHNDNVQKALACAYGFTETLVRLHVPVDVSLYSSAVTQLFDHRHDTLEPYFGPAGGYLSSGTHEVEAIAFAKQRADTVQEQRKLILVVTDGQPNGAALERAGGQDMGEYYRETLVPWLGAAGIDLLCIAIGDPPRYHPNVAAVAGGWDSLGVLACLLDEVIRRGEAGRRAFWS